MTFCQRLRSRLFNHGQRRVVIALPVVLALISMIAILGGEPSYRGRTLSSWLAQCRDTPLMEEARMEEAQQAVRAIGAAKALPRLLKMAQARDGRLRAWVIARSVEKEIPFLKDMSPAEDTQRLAVAGFEVLGAECASAVGVLTWLLDDTNHAFIAVRCLAVIGQPADLALCQSLTNKDAAVRHTSVSALSGTTDDVDLYIARLKDSLTDSAVEVRFAAVEAIGSQTEAPDAAIPLLITAMEDRSDHVSALAAKSLLDFGTNAGQAFQALSNVAENGSQVTASRALKTLATIAPTEALTVLLRHIKAPESRQRRVAARILGSYEIATPEILSALELAAADSDAQVARNAARSLTELRPLTGSSTNTSTTTLLLVEPLK